MWNIRFVDENSFQKNASAVRGELDVIRLENYGGEDDISDELSKIKVYYAEHNPISAKNIKSLLKHRTELSSLF